MKKVLLLAGSCFLAQFLMAQEPADALRFSWTVPGGTARTQAIGGAMGSLGGDISATFVNPAGLAFYKTGDFVFSPIVELNNQKATYFGRTEKVKENKLVWGTTGFVIGGANSGGKIKNSSFALAFNRSADFNNKILYRGQNNNSSYSQKYLDEIGSDRSGNSVSDNYPFGASLGFRTYWIDTVAGGTEGNFNFQSRAQNILGAGGLLQQQEVTSTGGINEVAFAGSANLNDKVMIGGSIGIPILNYTRNSLFTEADPSSNNNNGFNFATVEEDISTKGVGINLKAGVIFRPQQNLRLGLAFHTPTLYSLTDRSLITVTADVENSVQPWVSTSEDVTGDPSEFRYMLATPYRAIASASYVLHQTADVAQQRGFITADIEYVNYTANKFSEDNANGSDQSTKTYLNSLNTAIDNAYKGAVNMRLGGELKFTTLMVRAGAAYYGNPYVNINGEKGSKVNVSGGLGYRNKGFFTDLTYVHSLQKDVHFPYRLENGPYSGATINGSNGNVIMTVGFKF